MIARARAYACGEVGAAEEMRRRFVGGVGATEVDDPAALAAARAALRSLPAVGTDRSGPLGPGLLASGELGDHE